MKVRKRLPENGLRDFRNLTLGREVLVHRFTPCYRDDWRPRIPDKGVLGGRGPEGALGAGALYGCGRKLP